MEERDAVQLQKTSKTIEIKTSVQKADFMEHNSHKRRIDNELSLYDKRPRYPDLKWTTKILDADKKAIKHEKYRSTYCSILRSLNLNHSKYCTECGHSVIEFWRCSGDTCKEPWTFLRITRRRGFSFPSSERYCQDCWKQLPNREDYFEGGGPRDSFEKSLLQDAVRSGLATVSHKSCINQLNGCDFF